MPDITTQLQEKRLSSLKGDLVSGIWADQDKKKKIKKINFLLGNSVFLQRDPARKDAWLGVLESFDSAFLDKFMQAIINENIRYQKGERDILVELDKHNP